MKAKKDSRRTGIKSGSNAKNQGLITKQHAVENLKHTHAHSQMITIERSSFVALNERIPCCKNEPNSSMAQ